MKFFKISDLDGRKYSKISGDNNKIHIDEKVGYNSIFGEKICHGTLVVYKIFNLINLEKIIKNQKKYNIKIKFINFVKYNIKISVIKKSDNYVIYQDKQKIIEIKIINGGSNLKNLNIIKIKKNISINKKLAHKDNFKNISYLLNMVSKYVGTIYPGSLSLLKEININFDTKLQNKNDNIEIRSRKIDPRFPIIENKLLYKNFIIEFQSLIRPSITKNKEKIPSFIKNKIKKIKYNALIIGGSQGVGQDILKILDQNKKIIKITTYNINKIKKLNHRIIPLKLNVYKNLNVLDKIIRKYMPIRIFYFASPKIIFNNNLNKNVIDKYKYMFIRAPLKILSKCKFKDVSFFYPSTSNINLNKNSYYSKVKQFAEIKLKKICSKNKIPFNIVRLPALNSRQSVSVINPNPPSLIKFLKLNPKVLNKIF